MAKAKRRNNPKSTTKKESVPRKPVIPERLREYLTVLDFRKVRKEPRLLSLLFCDFISSTDDKKVNLLGIFDRVLVHPEEKQSPRFVIYGRAAEAFESPLWLTVLDPDNEPQAEVRFDPPAMPSKRDPDLPNQIQFMLRIAMRFEKAVTYWFDVSYQNKSLGGAGLVIGHATGGKEGATDTFT